MAHFGAEPSGSGYPDRDQYRGDLAAVYAAEIRQMATLGCRYLHKLDDTVFAFLNGPGWLQGRAEAAGGRGSSVRSAGAAVPFPAVRFRVGGRGQRAHHRPAGAAPYMAPDVVPSLAVWRQSSRDDGAIGLDMAPQWRHN